MFRARLASSEWLSHVERNLRILVDQFAEQDTQFSFCEVFTDAPVGSVGWHSGDAAYHYDIQGRQLGFAAGRAEDVDLMVIVDYKAAVSLACSVFTPTLRRRRAEGTLPPLPLEVIGDESRMPEWIREIHNMTVPFTAPDP